MWLQPLIRHQNLSFSTFLPQHPEPVNLPNVTPLHESEGNEVDLRFYLSLELADPKGNLVFEKADFKTLCQGTHCQMQSNNCIIKYRLKSLFKFTFISPLSIKHRDVQRSKPSILKTNFSRSVFSPHQSSWSRWEFAGCLIPSLTLFSPPTHQKDTHCSPSFYKATLC